MNSAVIDATIGEVVCQLLSEASRQFNEYTDLMETAASALKLGWREDALGLVEEAGKRLSNVDLLADEVRDWGLDDHTGIITKQAASIIDALAVANAEHRQAIGELNGTQAGDNGTTRY